MRKKRNKILAIFAIIAATIIWGINYPITKQGLEYYSPLWFFILKYGLATILFVFIFKQRGKKIARSDHVKIAIEAWLGLSGGIVLSYYALQHVRGIDAAIIYALAPMGLYWLSVTFLKERFRLQPLLGTTLALLGILIVAFDSSTNIDSSGSFTTAGIILLLLSVLLGIFGTIFIKPYLKKYDTHRLALYRFIYALIPITVLAFFLEPLPKISLHPVAIFSVLFGSLISVLVAFPLYYFGLKRLDGEDVGVLFYIEPVAGVLSSFFILNEAPSIYFGFGAILVVIGIIVAEVHFKKHVISHIPHLHRH